MLRVIGPQHQGEALLLLARQEGVARGEMAEVMGVSATQVSHYYKGNHRPSSTSLFRALRLIAERRAVRLGLDAERTLLDIQEDFDSLSPKRILSLDETALALPA